VSFEEDETGSAQGDPAAAQYRNRLPSLRQSASSPYVGRGRATVAIGCNNRLQSRHDARLQRGRRYGRRDHGGRRAQRPGLRGLPRRGGPGGSGTRGARGHRRRHRHRGVDAARVAARFVLQRARCPAVQPADPRRRTRAAIALRPVLPLHRPGRGDADRAGRCGGGAPRRRRHRRRVRQVVNGGRRRAEAHDGGLGRRPQPGTPASPPGFPPPTTNVRPGTNSCAGALHGRSSRARSRTHCRAGS
jgi:hypothetical protein